METVKSEARANLVQGKKLLIMSLVLGTFITCLGLSFLTPFFPKIAEKKGMSNSVFGFMITTMYVPQLVLIPIIPRLILKLGPRLVYALGCLSFIGALLGLAFVNLINSTVAFIAASFSCALFNGIGYAFVLSSTTFIITSYISENMSSTMAFIETGAGLGYCMGPFIGGLLHDTLGFSAPSIFFVVLIAMLVLFTSILFKKLPKETINFTDTEKIYSISKQLLKIPGLIIICLLIIVSFAITCFTDVFFSLYCISILHKTSFVIGIGLMIISVVYSISATFLGIFIKKLKNEVKLLLCGILLTSILFVTLAILQFELSVLNIIVLTSLIALANSTIQMIYVPAVEKMNNIAKSNGFPDDYYLSSSLATIFSSCLTTGLLIGNGLSGISFEYIGLGYTSIFFTAMLCLLGIAVLIFVKKSPLDPEERGLLNADRNDE